MELKTLIPLIVGAVIAIIIIVWLLMNQKQRVIEWLKYAVSMAEAELGKKTGQLKLRLVYDWFVEKFPIFAAICPFGVFSAWVDEALKTLNDWIKSKNQISDYIQAKEPTVIDK